MSDDHECCDGCLECATRIKNLRRQERQKKNEESVVTTVKIPTVQEYKKIIGNQAERLVDPRVDKAKALTDIKKSVQKLPTKKEFTERLSAHEADIANRFTTHEADITTKLAANEAAIQTNLTDTLLDAHQDVVTILNAHEQKMLGELARTYKETENLLNQHQTNYDTLLQQYQQNYDKLLGDLDNSTRLRIERANQQLSNLMTAQSGDIKNLQTSLDEQKQEIQNILNEITMYRSLPQPGSLPVGLPEKTEIEEGSEAKKEAAQTTIISDVIESAGIDLRDIQAEDERNKQLRETQLQKQLLDDAIIKIHTDIAREDPDELKALNDISQNVMSMSATRYINSILDDYERGRTELPGNRESREQEIINLIRQEGEKIREKVLEPQVKSKPEESSNIIIRSQADIEAEEKKQKKTEKQRIIDMLDEEALEAYNNLSKEDQQKFIAKQRYEMKKLGEEVFEGKKVKEHGSNVDIFDEYKKLIDAEIVFLDNKIKEASEKNKIISAEGRKIKDDIYPPLRDEIKKLRNEITTMETNRSSKYNPGSKNYKKASREIEGKRKELEVKNTELKVFEEEFKNKQEELKKSKQAQIGYQQQKNIHNNARNNFDNDFYENLKQDLIDHNIISVLDDTPSIMRKLNKYIKKNK